MVMEGPSILVATMSIPMPRGQTGAIWQYHSRSDHHSKVACWGVLFDLLHQSRLLRQHASQRKVILGVHFTLRDFATGRKKVLDLVIARPTPEGGMRQRSLIDLAREWNIQLTPAQSTAVATLPTLHGGPVGAVLMALEAKAAMTEHRKAAPRLYDELNSSHLTVHGASRQALAIGLVVVNVAPIFISPSRNRNTSPSAGATSVVSTHAQPAAAESIIAKVREIPRRRGTQTEGYDGLGVIVVDAVNDNASPVRLVTGPPGLAPGDVLHYDTMITRTAHEYDVNFANI